MTNQGIPNFPRGHVLDDNGQPTRAWALFLDYLWRNVAKTDSVTLTGSAGITLSSAKLNLIKVGNLLIGQGTIAGTGSGGTNAVLSGLPTGYNGMVIFGAYTLALDAGKIPIGAVVDGAIQIRQGDNSSSVQVAASKLGSFSMSLTIIAIAA